MIENRAWVGLLKEPEIISGNLAMGEIYLIIQNFRRTPAESVSVSINYFPSKPKFTLLNPSFESPRIISPSQPIHYTTEYISKDDSATAKIISGTLFLYVHGLIAYKVLYGGRDTTEFLFYFKNIKEIVPVAGFNRMK